MTRAGETLEARLGQGPLGVREATALGISLLRALERAHARGVVHRRVEPGTIILDAGPAGAVLIEADALAPANAELALDASRYLSPEQAGLLDVAVDARADLYAAGATLFACLAGRPAFPGATVGEVLRQHVGARPRLAAPVPSALDDVIHRLLRVDPRDRYPSASAAVADLETIGAMLDQGVDEPPFRTSRGHAPAEPALIGRVGELALLHAELASAMAGRGGLVLVEGPSGGGKTRLLDELGVQAAANGFWVLRGQGSAEAARRPFEVLSAVVADIAARAASEPGFAGWFRDRLGMHGAAACDALPGLAAPLGIVPDLLGPEEHGEVRTRRALAALLDALGAAARPALWLVDDGQWADELSASLLRDWQHAGDTGRPRHVVVVVASRSGEPATDPVLQLLRAAARADIPLPPLAAEEIRRLAESMLGALPDEAAALVVEHAAGNPFIATAILQGLVEGRALVYEQGRWTIDPSALAGAQVSRRAAATLARRVELLPIPVQRLLSAGAVLGRAFEPDLAARLAEQAPAEAEVAFAEARGRQFVWLSGGRYLFAHDKLRETLLARLSPEERRRFHRLAAEAIAAHHPERVFELAWHFDGAGEAERALPYALAAAERSRAQHALEIAAGYYAIAERGAAGADRATRVRVLEGLADVSTLRNRFDDAARPYAEARELAEDRLSRARIEGKLGEMHLRRGSMADACAHFGAGLRLLDRFVPGDGAIVGLAVGWEILVQACHTLWPRGFLGRGEAGPEDLVAAHLYSRLALAAWMSKGPLHVLCAHLRSLNLIERFHPTVQMGKAYAEHAWAMAVAAPNLRRGMAYADKGQAIGELLGDVWLVAHAHNCKAIALNHQSRFAESLAEGREAQRLMAQIGDRFEEDAAAMFQVECLYRMGELEQATARARERHGLMSGEGDAYSRGILFFEWARAAEGRVPATPRAIERDWSGPDRIRTQAVMRGHGLCALGEGRFEEAIWFFDEAEKAIREARLSGDFVVDTPLWLARALRLQAEATPAIAPSRRRALLLRAEDAARRGLRGARQFRNNLPQALRESALLAAIRGRAGRARRALDESLAVAARQGARFEHAQTLLARGQIGVTLGWPGAVEDITAADTALRAIRPGPERRPPGAGEVTLSLADRFTTLIEVGRKIAAALTRDAVFAATREAAATLLRADGCQVVDASVAPLDVDILRRALASPRPLVIEDAEELELAGVRSALAARVVVRDRPVAVLYATARQVGGLFSDEEVRLAEFITTLAGAALENAAGFAENERSRAEIGHLTEALVQGQESERRRLSLALHDGAGQLLTALSLRLDDAARRRPDDAGELAGMRGLVDDVLADLRGLAHDLRPAVLDRFGLAEALRDLATGASTATLAVTCEVEPEIPPALAGDVALHVFRIAQAALANVARHAGARHARVTLANAGGALRLEVEDDGVGFDPSSAGGVGLMGMRERAGWLGGTFRLDAAPGSGTRIAVTVPLPGGLS